ncbi:MAG: quercetin 2,3-dioxygenase [Actinomycetota bacterium]|nr:quercetin 2,3-dioxygenase [Actinomycetota bacterium]
MSNLERHPHETTAGGLATVSPEPVRRLLEAREVPLGGTRAMVVRRTLPHRDLPTVGAWCFADDYGPSDVRGSAGMQVPPHPHTGLQTVTWLLEGEVRHQDSVGSDQRVRPGQLSLMTAGRGITHAETSPADHPPTLRGLQLWVALPDRDRHVAPHFEHHAELPLLSDGGLAATLIVGELAGQRSPATAYTPLVGADVSLAADAVARLPLEPAFEHAVLAVSEGVVVDGEHVAKAAMVYLGCGRRDVALAGGPAGARLLLLGGAPLEEELLMWWNFVGRDHDEIVAFRTEWEAARTGASTRFGSVPRYDGAPLAAPELPTVRLKPRRRPPR